MRNPIRPTPSTTSRRTARTVTWPGIVLALLLLASGVALLAHPASAHHGWSGYHTTLETLTGKVVSYTYNNPHTALHLQVDAKTLEIVLAPPSRMERRGLQPDSFKPGDTVKVQGYIHRERDTELRAERVEVNGQTFELR